MIKVELVGMGKSGRDGGKVSTPSSNALALPARSLGLLRPYTDGYVLGVMQVLVVGWLGCFNLRKILAQTDVVEWLSQAIALILQRSPGLWRLLPGVPKCIASYIAVTMGLSKERSLGHQTGKPPDASKRCGRTGA